MLLTSALLLLAHEAVAYNLEAFVFATPPHFILWVGICAASYSALNGSNAASVTAAVDERRVGAILGALGAVDSMGSAFAPLYLQRFGVEGGTSTTHALALSRGLLGLPTALLLLGYAAQEVRRCAVARGAPHPAAML